MNFEDFKLNKKLLEAINELKYIEPTPIQEQSISLIIEENDLIGIAQTGTGKTAAFALPILNKILNNFRSTIEKKPKVLILAPTRELCAQIGNDINSFSKFTNIKTIVTYGGVKPEPQIEALKQKNEILVATPGRLLDLVLQKDVYLDEIEIFVLDEADKLIEMGLRTELRKILRKLPQKRQNLFFSATMNKEIKTTANELLNENAKIIEIEVDEVSLKLIDQNVLYVLKEHKIKALVEILKQKQVKHAIIFVNSKIVGDNLLRSLRKNNLKSEVLHSGKSNTHREKVIRHIKTRETKFLIATDLASRGLDFKDMEYVINFEIPLNFENYVHRVGRIGRANKRGISYSLCSLDERKLWKKIELENKYPIKTYMHELHSNLVKTDGGNRHKSKRYKPKLRKTSTGYNNRKKFK